MGDQFIIRRTALIAIVTLAGLVGCGGDKGIEPPAVDPVSPAPPILWQKLYAADSGSYADAVVAAPDGGFVITGFSSRADNTTDLHLMKIDAAGNRVWGRSFDGDDQDGGRGVVAAPDGGYVAVGNGGSRLFVVKVNAAGEEQWRQRYGDSKGGYVGAAIAADPAGGYVITGMTQWYAYDDVFVRKIDADGRTLWERKFGGTGIDQGWTITVTGDGGYLVTGTTSADPGTDGGKRTDDLYLLKLDRSGNTLWEKTILLSNNIFVGRSVVPDADGGFIVGAGHGLSYDSTGGMTLMGIDAQGNERWRRTSVWGSGSRGLALAPGGRVISLAGSCLHASDSLQSNLWTLCFPLADQVTAMTAASNGDYLVVGGTDTPHVGTRSKIYVARVARP